MSDGTGVRVGTDLTPEEARALTDEIRSRMENIAPLVTRAYEGRAWEVMGYPSWTEYVAGEFGGPLRLGRGDRQQVVAELRQAGLSTRGIGAALGVDDKTVRNDLSGADFSASATVTGLDGKVYPAAREITPEEQQFADGVWAEVHSQEWFLDLEVAVNDLRELKQWASGLDLTNRDKQQVETVRALVREAEGIVAFIAEAVR